MRKNGIRYKDNYYMNLCCTLMLS